jgi:ABC-type polysaccharide/polyol phosphate transport system ATPase subunit
LPTSFEVDNGEAIRIERVSKEYRLGGATEKYRTLRETVSRAVRAFAHGLRPQTRTAPESGERIWALRDVSFAVARGHAVGIIGRNGAGKSTLLKILSRVTEPTTGHVAIRGRVGSLLEVGTGFHNELTGRENIYLSGAILGMRRTEIVHRFDEIVAFAEIGAFLDTPVKRYSSGMYLRLAFSVAAHLEPEILLVDEVLAVGDAAFQKKCLGRMSEVTGHGRTVLFISHNMDAVQRLCSECVLLEQGRVAAYGPTPSVVAQYLSDMNEHSAPDAWITLSGQPRSGTGEARFVAAKYTSSNEAVASRAYPEGPLELTLMIDSDTSRSVGSLAVCVETLKGTRLIDADILARGIGLRLQPGRNLVRVRITKLHLNPGTYVFGFWLGPAAGSGFDYIPSAFQVEVVTNESLGYGVTPATAGVVACDLEVLQEP